MEKPLSVDLTIYLSKYPCHQYVTLATLRDRHTERQTDNGWTNMLRECSCFCTQCIRAGMHCSMLAWIHVALLTLMHVCMHLCSWTCSVWTQWEADRYKSWTQRSFSCIAWSVYVQELPGTTYCCIWCFPFPALGILLKHLHHLALLSAQAASSLMVKVAVANRHCQWMRAARLDAREGAFGKHYSFVD